MKKNGYRMLWIIVSTNGLITNRIGVTRYDEKVKRGTNSQYKKGAKCPI